MNISLLALGVGMAPKSSLFEKSILYLGPTSLKLLQTNSAGNRKTLILSRGRFIYSIWDIP